MEKHDKKSVSAGRPPRTGGSATSWALKNLPEFSDEDFGRWKLLLEEKTGIHLVPQQKAFLQAQINIRLRELGEMFVLELHGALQGAHLFLQVVVDVQVLDDHPERLDPFADLGRLSVMRARERARSPSRLRGRDCAREERVEDLGGPAEPGRPELGRARVHQEVEGARGDVVEVVARVVAVPLPVVHPVQGVELARERALGVGPRRGGEDRLRLPRLGDEAGRLANEGVERPLM